MKTYLYGPMNCAKTLKLPISCTGPRVARKKKVYQQPGGGRGRCTDVCPCGKEKESRTLVVGEGEMCKEEWDALEMRGNIRT